MPLPSLAEQLAQCAQAHPGTAKLVWPLNPFPPGMREGCCTRRVWDALVRAYPHPLEHRQIRDALDLSRGAVSWALRYLESRDLVARLYDPRNPQYRRWRAFGRTFQKGDSHD